MEENVPIGQHQIKVEVSLNGQQFTSNGVSFLYNSIDPKLTEEDLKKMDEAEEKAKGKAPPKKK
jgi:outer membrane usher protein FimD/PapC